MQFVKFSQENLCIEELQILGGSPWCFYGGNNSGIEEFFTLLAGNDKQKGIMPKAETVSFAKIQEIVEEERKNDDSDFLDHHDPGTLAIDFLPAHSAHHPLVAQLNMSAHLGTGFQQLSSGQVRKLLLLKAILGRSREILLHSPYDGLDTCSRKELDENLATVCRSKQIFLFVHNKEDIPQWCSQLAVFEEGKLILQGERDQILAQIIDKPKEHQLELEGNKQQTETLICLRQGSAGYGEKTIFSGLDLTINSGEHTLVYGPNGCGKSTLLQLICGDHPHCYSNDLTLFGKKRGSGESIWEVKSQMGIVSPDLHRNHRRVGSALEVVISGLYDSIGLYNKPTREERRKAEKWLSWIGMEKQKEKAFSKLSFAQQRLVLIARGLIKMPKLLILDEASQGLDGENRSLFLAILDKIAKERLSTILFVSHRADEYQDFFQQQIDLAHYNHS